MIQPEFYKFNLSFSRSLVEQKETVTCTLKNIVYKVIIMFQNEMFHIHKSRVTLLSVTMEGCLHNSAKNISTAKLHLLTMITRSQIANAS